MFPSFSKFSHHVLFCFRELFKASPRVASPTGSAGGRGIEIVRPDGPSEAWGPGGGAPGRAASRSER